jgi:Fuc2NAc and GlcNAc transferase
VVWGWLALPLATAVAASALTGLLHRYAIRSGMLDRPNERSSHSLPTPRGGGVAIVIASGIAILALALLRVVEPHLATALLGGGIAVAVVGFLDDRHHVSVRVRLAIHVAAAVWALLWLCWGLVVGGRQECFNSLGIIFGVLAVVWTLNLVNFMDGIDGIAASEAVFVAWSGCGLALYGGEPGSAAISLAFGAACLGFLLWNWPPAKIFMGDAGSGYIGFVIAVVALDAAARGAVALSVWAILGGVFIVDATVTLIRRMIAGESLHVAHRSHAYQRLARRWQSHRRVTVAVVMINLFWLLPWATAASLHPNWTAWVMAVALVPLVVITLAVGAGQRDS